MPVVDSAALRAVRKLAEIFRANNIEVVDNDTGFDWDSPFGPCNVRVEEPDEESRENGVANVIRIETVLEAQTDPETDKTLGLVNRVAMLSAAIRRDDDVIVSASKLSVFTGFEAALDAELQLLFAATFTQGDSFARGAEIMFRHRTDFDRLPQGDEPGGWTEEQFASEASHFEYPSTTDGRSMTSELPWSHETVAGKEQHASSLLMLKAQEHPACGNGLLYQLDLPLGMKDPADTCRRLNLVEWDLDYAPPLLGAWSIGPSDNPSFVGFIPNAFYHPHFIHRVVTWLRWRHDIARQLFGEAPIE